jgi:hypothetical protein
MEVSNILHLTEHELPLWQILKQPVPDKAQPEPGSAIIESRCSRSSSGIRDTAFQIGRCSTTQGVQTGIRHQFNQVT